jgi:putative FmdB family regulatory protein
VPTYDYRCSSCGERVEIVHSINGGPPETCPRCGAFGTLRKAFAAPAIHFKGSGWAKKERHAAVKSRAGGSAESGTEPAAPDGAKGETPAETKAAKSDGGDRGTADGGGASGGEGAKPKPEPAGG